METRHTGSVDDDVKAYQEQPSDRLAIPNPTAPSDFGVHTPAICVICLERVSDEATALPCQHDQFHFSCLGTWLNQSRSCPLCKSAVKSIKYRDQPHAASKVYHLSEQKPASFSETVGSGLRRRRTRRRHDCSPTEQDQGLAFRKYVHENQLYSLYIGANRFNGYRNITPDQIRQNPAMVTKAKKWIRRELSVFDFLNPDSPSFGRSDRRATNAEYLLEYIIAIIAVIDLKGSAGQAQELLKEFLGRENAQLFLHELEAWLRSPYESLREWDQAVQYPQQKL